MVGLLQVRCCFANVVVTILVERNTQGVWNDTSPFCRDVYRWTLHLINGSISSWKADRLKQKKKN